MRYPRESAAYVGAINAYAEINEFEKMERVYKSVLRTFGGHPNTYGRMAKMYWNWHKRQQAEELAIRALQGNPNQPEALEIELIDGQTVKGTDRTGASMIFRWNEEKKIVETEG